MLEYVRSNIFKIRMNMFLRSKQNLGHENGDKILYFQVYYCSNLISNSVLVSNPKRV